MCLPLTTSFYRYWVEQELLVKHWDSITASTVHGLQTMDGLLEDVKHSVAGGMPGDQTQAVSVKMESESIETLLGENFVSKRSAQTALKPLRKQFVAGMHEDPASPIYSHAAHLAERIDNASKRFEQNAGKNLQMLQLEEKAAPERSLSKPSPDAELSPQIFEPFTAGEKMQHSIAQLTTLAQNLYAANPTTLPSKSLPHAACRCIFGRATMCRL